MEDIQFNPDDPLDYLPNYLRKVFIEQAQFLYYEFNNNFLKIDTAPAPIKKHADHKIRVVESYNPAWYSELYNQTNRGKRHLFKKSLERITQGKDKKFRPNNNWYNYDSLFRKLIYSRLVDGYFEHKDFVEPNNNVREFFNLPAFNNEFNENYEKQIWDNKNVPSYEDEVPF